MKAWGTRRKAKGEKNNDNRLKYKDICIQEAKEPHRFLGISNNLLSSVLGVFPLNFYPLLSNGILNLEPINLIKRKKGSRDETGCKAATDQ